MQLYLRSSPEHRRTYYGVLSDGEELKRAYEAKCTEHGDRGYPFVFTYGPGPNMVPNSFPDKDFRSIEVVSDTDFDEAHPAGTRLDDVMMFCSASPWRFIRSRYVEQGGECRSPCGGLSLFRHRPALRYGVEELLPSGIR